MVACSQPLAAAAALRVLQDGGNAVDAAITAAAVLAVVEPTMTGIGGDMFAQVWMAGTNRPVGLNGNGWSGSGATLEYFQKRGHTEIPGLGMASVSVPGAVAGWFKLHGRFGTLPMHRLLESAIGYAENGYAVSDIIATQWQSVEQKLAATPEGRETFLIADRAPRHGQIFRNPELARSLRVIVEEGRDGFYKGELAERIVRFSNAHDGHLSVEDLAEFDAEWVDPVSCSYRGYDVFELGPTTQGIVALEMLNILEGFDLASMEHNSGEYLHLLVEAKKLAFADRDAYIADPRMVPVPTARLASREYAARRRKQLNRGVAMAWQAPGILEEGDTVYLSVVDGAHNAVSFINSIFANFGSGMVVPQTGIMLHNRGSLFALDSRHPNCVQPRKRPFHTLIPAMVGYQGRPFFSFGVMGGDMQPQGHVQVLANLIDFGMDVQQAGEAPRFRHFSQGLALETAISSKARFELIQKGHAILSGVDMFGGYQGVLIEPDSGVLMGGSDVRKDGLAIGW